MSVTTHYPCDMQYLDDAEGYIDESGTYKQKIRDDKTMAGSDFKNRSRYIICIVFLLFVCLALIVSHKFVCELYVKPGACNKNTSISALEKDTITLQEITDKAETRVSTHRYDESGATTLSNKPEAGITAHHYGVLKDGRQVTRYTLQNGYMRVQILNFGGIITHIRVPDKNGKTDDIVLGFENLEEYERRSLALGAIVGRYANIIANNKFSLDGVTYTLEEKIRASNSSSKGFSKRLWDSRIEKDALILTYVSPYDEDGFPGNVNVTVTYELTDRNELIITYRATTDKATVINLTNRSFFNLAGHSSGHLNDHTVRIVADSYTPVDDNNIPTGITESVKHTKYDTTANTRLGSRLTQVPGGRGYDTNFAFGMPDWDKHMASVSHAKSGRTLDIYSTEPGLQFNTGYNLQSIMGKGGVVYNQFGGFSLEAQHYPNSPNEPRFPTTILRPGSTYIQETKYVFGTHV